jgi:hypothetical protein
MQSMPVTIVLPIIDEHDDIDCVSLEAIVIFLFGVVGILALVVIGSHRCLPLLADKWVMASWKPSPVYLESPVSIPKRRARPF